MTQYSLKIKIALLALFFCSFTREAIADEVPLSQVRQVAIQAFANCSILSNSEVTIKDIIPLRKNDTVLLYICNFEKGFVIVSADDVARPILGYGNTNPFDTNNIAPAVDFIINGYKEEVLNAKRTQAVSSSDIQDEWRTLINNDINRSFYTTGTYLILTQWSQHGGYILPSNIGYNYYCPKRYVYYNDSCTTIVGCGAVALAQILHYWSCDVYPHGTVYNNNENIYLNLSSQSYQWYDMHYDKADIYNAKLLADCAVAINSIFACFSPDTGTNSYPLEICNKLKNNYGFTNANLEYKTSDDVWIAKLKNDLSQRYPIFYAGSDININSSHGWIVDGFDNNNMFHCNFGWGGNGDGWYLLTSINPGSYNYNYQHHAILHCYPTTFANTEFINSNISTGTYNGHKIIIENSSINNNATVVMDPDCSTEIFGPFTVPIGSTLHVK